MNGRVIQIFCMVVGIVLASSCGDECPVEQPYSVRVSVKDKNYLNISQFPQLGSVDENQPFRTYTGTIYYALYDASTGALKRESEIVQINGEDKEYTISFAGIPDGDYKLAVWGNLTTPPAFCIRTGRSIRIFMWRPVSCISLPNIRQKN